MTKYQAQRVVRQESVIKYDYTVKTVRARPGNVFIPGPEFSCSDSIDARDSADRLQREFDEDGDPCRTYVYKGADPLPLYAGLQAKGFRG